MARTANPLTKVKKQVSLLKQKVEKVNGEIASLSALIDEGLKVKPASPAKKPTPRATVGKGKSVKRPAVKKAVTKPVAKKAITAKARNK
jgi:hypothetical protein